MHISVHSSQMKILGPAISWATSSWLLPQNEQKMACRSFDPAKLFYGKLDAKRPGHAEQRRQSRVAIFVERLVEPLSRDPRRSRDRRHAARPGHGFERIDDGAASPLSNASDRSAVCDSASVGNFVASKGNVSSPRHRSPSPALYVAYGSRHGDVGKNPFCGGCAVRSSGIPSASRASARLPFGRHRRPLASEHASWSSRRSDRPSGSRRSVAEVFLPKLGASGVDRSTIDKLTRDNPFRAFALLTPAAARRLGGRIDRGWGGLAGVVLRYCEQCRSVLIQRVTLRAGSFGTRALELANAPHETVREWMKVGLGAQSGHRQCLHCGHYATFNETRANV